MLARNRSRVAAGRPATARAHWSLQAIRTARSIGSDSRKVESAAGSAEFGQFRGRRPVVARSDDDVRGLVDDVGLDAAPGERPEDPEGGDVGAEDQDGLAAWGTG